jgi:hypothetical protein
VEVSSPVVLLFVLLVEVSSLVNTYDFSPDLEAENPCSGRIFPSCQTGERGPALGQRGSVLRPHRKGRKNWSLSMDTHKRTRRRMFPSIFSRREIPSTSCPGRFPFFSKLGAVIFFLAYGKVRWSNEYEFQLMSRRFATANSTKWKRILALRGVNHVERPYAIVWHSS